MRDVCFNVIRSFKLLESERRVLATLLVEGLPARHRATDLEPSAAKYRVVEDAGHLSAGEVVMVRTGLDPRENILVRVADTTVHRAYTPDGPVVLEDL